MSEPAIQNPRSSDVTIYVRHLNTCTKKKATDCGCPLWLYDKKTQRRFSAKTTSWTQAKIEKQKVEDSHDPVKVRLAELERKAIHESVLLDQAIENYLTDKENDGVKRSTLKSYRILLGAMAAFAHTQGVYNLRDVTANLLLDWKNQWPYKTKRSKQSRRGIVRTFFMYCAEIRHWIDINANPALALGKITGKQEVAAVPYTKEQYEAILKATEDMRTWSRIENGRRLRALIQLQRYSGLAIQDAVTLERWRIDENGDCKVQRTKTGTWVTVPIPPAVVAELRALECKNPEYFFWTGNSNPETVAIYYQNAYRKLWKLVKWPTPLVDGDKKAVKPHSHMFRHTFAHHFLNTPDANGRMGDIRDLQLLLGHTRLATTELHYVGFMPDAADRLKAEVRARWEGEHKPQPQPEAEHHVRIPFRRRASHRR
jgi:site-specific recombinase XerD